jgi:RimJ/RimL family protein N-acetyltransferase
MKVLPPSADQGPVLETPRLWLRLPREEDCEAWAAFSGDEQTMRFLGGPQTPATAWRALATMAGSWALRGYGMFSVIEKSSGVCIGRIGPWSPHLWPGTEIGWGLRREWVGQGLAVEAAAASMDFAVDVLGWSEIIHCIDPENHPSIAVAERLGSRRLRPVSLPPPFDVHTIIAWGQSADDWKARRARA